MVKDRLTIAMNGFVVGCLTRDRKDVLYFSYDPSWLESSKRRPISTSMQLTDEVFSGSVVFNFFQNLLPDNKQIIQRLQQRLSIPRPHPFDILSVIGRDCVGALQLYPSDTPPPSASGITGEKLSEAEIAYTLRNYQKHPLGMDSHSDFRISVAGAQEKTALLYLDNQWFRPTGATATTHILKLPIGVLSGTDIDLTLSCENEWLCLLISKLYGFTTADAFIQRFEDVKALVVKRFDRYIPPEADRIIRLPTEDFCQALNVDPSWKYEADGGPGIFDIMNFLYKSSRADQDRETFFKTQVLFWLLEATDGHAKNFSIFLEPNSNFRLTPLYDIMSAAPLTACGSLSSHRIKLAMGLLGKNKHYRFHDIEPRHFLSTAAVVGVSEDVATTWLKELAEKTPSVIEAASRQLPPDFPTNVSEPIFSGMMVRSEKIRRFLAAQ